MVDPRSLERIARQAGRRLRGGVAMTLFLPACVAAFLPACVAAVAPPVPEVGEPPLSSFPAEVAWTARPDVALERTGEDAAIIARPFTRLEVLGQDTLGVHVRCAVCDRSPDGVAAPSDLVYEALPPEVAAWGSLAEFALSLRHAAASRDLEALRPVMPGDFIFSFVGPQTPHDAFAVWRSEDFVNFDRIPDLLDRGFGTIDGRIWAAPPEYADDLNYRGLRLGVRQQPDGRWEWIFLVRGILG
ncbi:MAG TPA: hypothetical protein VMN39_01060 [Longimicrobiaceae bacterium]|nr:hypothetical protein [Longimicrobiaceae bacterium]